jgi:hypothetical protein
MAEIDFDRFEGERGYPPPGGALARAVSLGAAAVSVALVLGLAVWGYRLAVRDATGVPVVRAIEGPMRVPHADPGGVIAAHLGLAVNGVAAEGAAGAPADRLVLAPPPVDLAAEDAAGTIAALAPPASSRAEGAVALALPPAPAAPPRDDAIAAALAEALAQDPAAVARLAGSATELAGSLDAGPAAAPVLRRAEGMPRGAFASAVRPMPRPAAIVAAGLPPAPAAGPAPQAAEIDAATLAAGARLVQLGAFETADLARAEWDRVAARFPAQMTGKARVVQEAQSGGRPFWRLRAQGFETEGEARRFCADLLAAHLACIPVTVQ